MVPDYAGPYRFHSTHIMHSVRVSQSLRFGQELGRVQHHDFQRDQHGLSPHPYPQPQFRLQPHPHPYSSAQSHDWHKAIQIEIEKERIRQEMIMSEILRRCALEAEVRREIRGGNGFPFRSPSPMGLDLPMRLPMAETRAEEKFLDERSMSLMQRHILNNTHEGGRSESLPFQRASNDVRMARDSEVKSVSECSNKKKKIVLPAKPIENITRPKRARLDRSPVNLNQMATSRRKRKRTRS